MLALVAYILGALCFISLIVLLSFIPKTTIKILALSAFSLAVIIGVTMMLFNVSGQSDISSLFDSLSSSTQKNIMDGARVISKNDVTNNIQTRIRKTSLWGILNNEGTKFMPKDDSENVLNDFLGAWQQYDGDTMLQYTDGFARENLEKELPLNGDSPIEWCEVKWVDEKETNAKSAYVNITAANSAGQPVDIWTTINLGYINDTWYITDIVPDEPKNHIFDVSDWLTLSQKNMKYSSDIDLTYLLGGVWEDYKLINLDGSEDNIFGTTFMFYPDGTLIDEYDGITNNGYWWVDDGLLNIVYDSDNTAYSWPIQIEYDPVNGSYFLHISLEGPYDDEISIMIKTFEIPPDKTQSRGQKQVYTNDSDILYFLDGVWDDYEYINADGSKQSISGMQWTFYPDGAFEEYANGTVSSGRWQLNSDILSVVFDSHDVVYTWPIYIEYYPEINEYFLYMELSGSNTGDTSVMIKTTQNAQPKTEFKFTVSDTSVQVGEPVIFEITPDDVAYKYVWVIDGAIYGWTRIEYPYATEGVDSVEIYVYDKYDNILFEDKVDITVGGVSPSTTPTPSPTPTTTATATPTASPTPTASATPTASPKDDSWVYETVSGLWRWTWDLNKDFSYELKLNTDKTFSHINVTTNHLQEGTYRYEYWLDADGHVETVVFRMYVKPNFYNPNGADNFDHWFRLETGILLDYDFGSRFYSRVK